MLDDRPTPRGRPHLHPAGASGVAVRSAGARRQAQGTGWPPAPEPRAPAAAGRDLGDRVEALRRTIASWGPLVDAELEATVTAALAGLDHVACLGCVLPVDQQAAWAEELEEIEDMAREVDAYLRDASRAGDGT
jgi:hypothetical protein